MTNPTGGTPTIASNYTPTQSAESYIFYNAMSKCLGSDAIWEGTTASSKTFTYADASSGNWFVSAPTPNDGYALKGMGAGLSYENGGRAIDQNISCVSGKSADWMSTAAVLWGYVNSDGSADLLGLLCDIGARAYSTTGASAQCNSSTNTSAYTYDMDGSNGILIPNLATNFQQAIKGKIGADPTILTNPIKYALYKGAFIGGCLETTPDNVTPWTDSADASSPKYYANLKMVDDSGTLTTANYLDTSTGMNNRTSTSTIMAYTQPNGSERKMKCSDLAAAMNEFAGDYQAWILQNGPDELAENVSPTNDNQKNSDTCGSSVTGIGWIVCPVLNSVAALNDTMWSVVQKTLNVSPLDSNGTIYNGWATIRSIANVLFVIFFMVIIFSQLTGVGITNYGIKKLLPRVIICAILVNASFLILQLSVDVANILGKGLYDLILGMSSNVQQVSWWRLLTDVGSGGVLAVGGAVGAAATYVIAGGSAASFFLILAFALAAALGLLVGFLTVIIRQAAIPVLAILAPLAFVAYLLPNTESWFKKWRSAFIALLLMYPIAAVVFAGSQFAAMIIIGEGGFWNYLIGLVIMALPLFSLPFIARQGGSLLTKVNGALTGVANKARKPIDDNLRERRAQAKAKWLKQSSDHFSDDPTSPDFTRRRNIFDRSARRAGRGLAGDKLRREDQMAADTEEFKTQARNNQVTGVTGRTVEGRQAFDSANAAKQHTSVDSTDSSNRIREQNPSSTMGHINEREYGTAQEKERTEGRRDEGLNDDHRFDIARTEASNAKTDAKAATDRASGRVETDLTTRVAKGNAQAAAKTLAQEEARTEEYITEATTTTSPGGIPVGSPAAAIQAAHGAELRGGEFGTRRAKAANQHAADQVNKEYEETIAPPTPPNTPIPTTAEAIEAAGIGGPTAITSEKASAKAAQDERETVAVGKRAKLISSTYDTSHLADGATQELIDSVGAGDEIGARAAVGILAKSTGGPGRRGLGAAIAGIPAGTVDDTTRSIKNAVVAADIKAKDAAIHQWSLDPRNRDLQAIIEDPNTYSVTAEELATQNIDSIRSGIACTGITHKAAQDALDSTAAKNMDPDVRALLESV
jgi:hypothetical protein